MTRCAGGVWVEVSMGRIVLVRKATKGSLEDRSMSRPANSLSMRDFGGEERRGHVVEAVFDLDLQVRIGEQRLHQIAFNVGRAGEEAAAAAGLVLPVPVTADAFADGVVGLVLAELQVIANVAVKCGGERSGDGSALRVGLGEFA